MSAIVMSQQTAEASPLSSATVATLFYLTSIVTGGAAAFVRWSLVVSDNATATAANILSHESLFRLLFAADIISVACYVAVTLLFFELFAPLHKRLSGLMAILGLTASVIVMFASFFQAAAWIVLRSAQHWNVLAVKSLPALAFICLQLRARAYGVGLLFVALHCALVAYLVLSTAPRKKVSGDCER